MLVMSFKTSKQKLLLTGIVTLLIIVAFSLVFLLGGSKSLPTAVSAQSTEAADDASRVKFLEAFGWQVSQTPVQIEEVIIPDEFDSVYEKYNRLQKKQQMDLSKYKSKRAKRYTYQVLNYPGRSDGVVANILIFDNKVIGGDICSLELNGFMHGFDSKNTME